MKAPEKLYLHPTTKGEVGANWLTFQLTNEDVEYVSKDAFIEKACEWLENHSDYLRVLDNGRCVRFDMTQRVSNFRKAMKGE